MDNSIPYIPSKCQLAYCDYDLLVKAFYVYIIIKICALLTLPALLALLALALVYIIIWEMFHGRISLTMVLLLLLVNFVSVFSLELMHDPSP